MSIRRTFAAVAITAGVLASGIIAAAPASAAQSDCPSGAACNWIDGSWVGFLTPFYQSINDYRDYSMSDKATSVYNNGNLSQVRMYDDINYGGSYVTLAIKTGDGNLQNNVGTIANGWDDRFSSGRFI